MADGIYKVSEWVMRLAYVNFLFILFSAVGLVIFGVGPAFIAMLAVINKWFEQEEFPVFKTYWSLYKKELTKGNALGLICIGIGSVLIINFYIVQQFEPTMRLVLISSTVMLTLLFMMTFIYVFVLRMKYQIGVKQCLKYSFILGVTRPLYFIVWLGGAFVIYNLLRFIPGLIPFFVFSIHAVWIFLITRGIQLKGHI